MPEFAFCSDDMVLNASRIPPKEQRILAGLYLAKYDSVGLKRLGFKSFVEAFNVLGYAMNVPPASIKNYRDEFDPLFPNRRKGWHKRPTRDYCLKVFECHKDLDLDRFAGLVRSFAGYDENAWSQVEGRGETDDETMESGFAKRLITGLAAEQYFESVQPSLPEFEGYASENTTRLGCGYDFRLTAGAKKEFVAVEVKGLRERFGTLSLTPKEHATAAKLRDRFFLFVVKNFRERPFHEIIRNPLSGSLRFTRTESVTVHVSWLVKV